MDEHEQIATSVTDHPVRSLTLRSDDQGYGFVLQGSAPVFIHKIQPGGMADKAGLKEGEIIVNVS
jgi:S1-C subfamily serine protease